MTYAPSAAGELTSPAHPGYVITEDRQRVDLGAVHAFLAHSYWSPGIPRATVVCAIEHPSPARLMEILDPDVYKAASTAGSGPYMPERSGYDS